MIGREEIEAEQERLQALIETGQVGIEQLCGEFCLEPNQVRRWGLEFGRDSLEPFLAELNGSDMREISALLGGLLLKGFFIGVGVAKAAEITDDGEAA